MGRVGQVGRVGAGGSGGRVGRVGQVGLVGTVRQVSSPERRADHAPDRVLGTDTGNTRFAALHPLAPGYGPGT